MEILNISLNKYTLICPSCCQLARIKIYPEKRQIKSKCIDGHKHKNISYNSFIGCCLASIWSSNKECKICYTKINEFKDNYICKICRCIFCASCIETHFKNSNHNDKIKYINYNSICQIHNEKYELFCITCNSNLCNKCRIIHKGHTIKSYKKYFKFIKNEINNFNSTIEENRRKIKYVKNKVNNWNLDGFRRKRYLELLYVINEYYLNNFNFELFHFYHFQNLKYFYEFVPSQINSIISVPISYEYIPFRYFIKDNKSLQIKKFQNKKYLFYNNINNFIFYDNNLLFIFFFISNCCYLKLFEIQNYSLRFILLKNFGETATPFFRPMKKSYEYFFVFGNIIMIFKYDENNQILTLKDKFKNNFYIKDISDLKNGDIIITTGYELRIRKAKKTYKVFNGRYGTLYQINDLMLISGSYFFDGQYSKENNEIIFFDTIKYQIIKKINIFPNLKVKNILNHDKFIIVITETNEFTYIIDIKYLEIIHIIENKEIFDRPYRIQDNFHYILYNSDIYMASNNKIKKIKKFNIYNYEKPEKKDETEKYYFDFDLVRFTVDKKHLFLIGNNIISEIDLLL